MIDDDYEYNRICDDTHDNDNSNQGKNNKKFIYPHIKNDANISINIDIDKNYSLSSCNETESLNIIEKDNPSTQECSMRVILIYSVILSISLIWYFLFKFFSEHNDCPFLHQATKSVQKCYLILLVFTIASVIDILILMIFNCCKKGNSIICGNSGSCQKYYISYSNIITSVIAIYIFFYYIYSTISLTNEYSLYKSEIKECRGLGNLSWWYLMISYTCNGGVLSIVLFYCVSFCNCIKDSEPDDLKYRTINNNIGYNSTESDCGNDGDNEKSPSEKS